MTCIQNFMRTRHIIVCYYNNLIRQNKQIPLNISVRIIYQNTIPSRAYAVYNILCILLGA